MKKILLIGTEDSLFDNFLNLANVNLFNILYSSDADIGIYLITLFIPDFILCAADIDEMNYNMILNFLRKNQTFLNVPVIKLTDIDISNFCFSIFIL